MSWYSFTAVWPNGRSYDAGATNSPDNDRARRYARLLIRELKERPDYHGSGLKMIVKNGKNDLIAIISF
jgi:hypothetical protein